jgi:hypothetical protein
VTTSTANRPAYPASPRQIDYLNSLRVERGLSVLTAAEAQALTGGMGGSASREIDRLKALPRQPRVAEQGPRGVG